MLDLARFKAGLEAGIPAAQPPSGVRRLPHTLNQEMRFLSAKPVIYAGQRGRGRPGRGQRAGPPCAVAAEQGAEVVVLCAALGGRHMVGMDPAEWAEYLDLAGVTASGFDQVIRHSYHLLGLDQLLHHGFAMLRAWTIRRGMTAPPSRRDSHRLPERASSAPR
ncbi:MAG: hypothetical protein R3A10_12715 [Caldilineaceae bacterium]